VAERLGRRGDAGQCERTATQHAGTKARNYYLPAGRRICKKD